MKFYNREKELDRLDEIRRIAFGMHSQMTVVTGRRRIGKTKLIVRSCEGTPTVYLFVARSNETALCGEFSEVIRRSLNTFVPDGIQTFSALFEHLMLLGRMMKFNLIIDEFQEFMNINSAIFSHIQNIWDRHKDDTHVNFIASGSVFTLMHKIFLDYGEPLYGRCDAVIRLHPFATSVLKEILRDHNPEYTNDDLLALYTITGGVPKYIEYLMARGAVTVEQMYHRVFEENSIFLEEGTILLVQEFGKRYGTYFSLLAAIASGRTIPSEIAQAVGESGLGAMLVRLDEDYQLVRKMRPIFAKERSQSVRYEISDNFLRFWFRYVYHNLGLVQLGRNEELEKLALADYPTYSGVVLERYFKKKLAEEGRYREIGSWWLPKLGLEASEIDIVAIHTDNQAATVAEVKRKQRNYDHKSFMTKVERIKSSVLAKYEITTRLLTLEDM